MPAVPPVGGATAGLPMRVSSGRPSVQRCLSQKITRLSNRAGDLYLAAIWSSGPHAPGSRWLPVSCTSGLLSGPSFTRCMETIQLVCTGRTFFVSRSGASSIPPGQDIGTVPICRRAKRLHSSSSAADDDTSERNHLGQFSTPGGTPERPPAPRHLYYSWAVFQPDGSDCVSSYVVLEDSPRALKHRPPLPSSAATASGGQTSTYGARDGLLKKGRAPCPPQ